MQRRGVQRCFNGHRRDRRGCAGCHHAFHVVRPGSVADGDLVPPVVEGPEDCDLCHEARHDDPVSGCPRCDDRFDSALRSAMRGSIPVRQEIIQLQFAHWFIGWRARLAGWGAILVGGTAGLFDRGDGSFDWVKTLVATVSVPLLQWILRRAIERKQHRLPRLTPKGEIVYGADDAT